MKVATILVAIAMLFPTAPAVGTDTILISNHFLSVRGVVKATAYCSCPRCCGKWSKHRLTKSGVRPVQGQTIAADLSWLPLGTQLRLEGIGLVTVQDTGSGLRGLHVDVYHEDHSDAVRFGIRYLRFEIHGKGIGSAKSVRIRKQ